MVRSLRSRPVERNGLKEQTSSSSIESEEYLQITPRRIWVKSVRPIFVIRGLHPEDWPHNIVAKKSATQENGLKRKSLPTRISPRKKQRFWDHEEPSNGHVNVDLPHNDHHKDDADRQLSVELSCAADSEEPIDREERKNSSQDVLIDDNDATKDIENPQNHVLQVLNPPSVLNTPLPTIVEPAEPTARSRDLNNLLPSDLPPPFLPIPTVPASEPFSDAASAILYAEYPPLPPLASFLGPMTSQNLSTLSTATLTALALNTHRALSAWQDVYILLDQQTAPIANPPKKPANGGRVPLEKRAWEVLKAAELSAFCTLAAPTTAGRGMRRRRNAEDLLGLPSSTHGVLSEDDTGVGKRARKPVRRFDIASIGSNGARGERQQSQASSSHLNHANHTNGTNGVLKRGPRVAALINQDLQDQRAASSTPELSTEAETSDQDDSTSADDENEHRRRRGGAGRGGRLRGRGGRANGRGGAMKAAGGPSGVTSVSEGAVAGEGPGNGVGVDEPGAAATRKPRVKSEKRSESMTAWWAERKRKAAEAKLQLAAVTSQQNQQTQQRSQPQAVEQPMRSNRPQPQPESQTPKPSQKQPQSHLDRFHHPPPVPYRPGASRSQQHAAQPPKALPPPALWSAPTSQVSGGAPLPPPPPAPLRRGTATNVPAPAPASALAPAPAAVPAQRQEEAHRQASRQPNTYTNGSSGGGFDRRLGLGNGWGGGGGYT